MEIRMGDTGNTGVDELRETGELTDTVTLRSLLP